MKRLARLLFVVLIFCLLSSTALAASTSYTTGSIYVGTTELYDPPYVFLAESATKETDTDNIVNHKYHVSSGDSTVRNNRLRFWTSTGLSATAAGWWPSDGQDYEIGLGGTRIVPGVKLKIKGRANTDCTSTMKFSGTIDLDP